MQKYGAVVQEAVRLAEEQFILLNEQQLDTLYKFRIPQLSTDGTCSLKTELDPEPFNLNNVYNPDAQYSFDLLKSHPNTKRLLILKNIVQILHKALDNVNWLGLYRKVTYDQIPNLLKESYVGSESRPLFPLTDDFAELSNNSWVAMNGQVKLIQDIKEYAGPYYECNQLVQSEYCAPIFYNNEVIGIIDVEAHQPNFFTQERLDILSQVLTDLGNSNLFV
eukprot:TRINITY_DN9152_c0_g1_i1.p1 TRINITY_DN9152_c0_g1~~TRINITY_DN9152_c0_g1_i1.p1  ORF type:complete len:221 (-),score=28.11 TRINITY_DN9152_c0_g1_i1:61-723(-)